MNIALWTAQTVLAGVFLISGVLKSSWSKERLVASGQTGVKPFPTPVIRLAAVSELFAVAGLILPWATGIVPVLTPLAAVGLCVVMAGAVASHGHLLRTDRAAGRGSRELLNVLITAALLGLCVFVAAGRF